MKQLSGLIDTNLRPIPYNVPIRFIWWACGLDGLPHEIFYRAKVRKSKRGDYFEFYAKEDYEGNVIKNVHFTHRITAINSDSDDYEIIDKTITQL